METHLGFWSEIEGNETEERRSDLGLRAMFMRRDHENQYEDCLNLIVHCKPNLEGNKTSGSWLILQKA